MVFSTVEEVSDRVAGVFLNVDAELCRTLSGLRFCNVRKRLHDRRRDDPAGLMHIIDLDQANAGAAVLSGQK